MIDIIRPHRFEDSTNVRGPEFDSVNWQNFREMPSPNFELPLATTMSEAREKLEKYLSQQEVRYEILRRFLADNGVILEMSESSINSVNAFYADNVFSNEDRTDIEWRWKEFSWHYGFFLGNFAIQEAKDSGKKLRWCARDISVKKLGETIRIVFRISNYKEKLFEWRPDFEIIQCGRFVAMHGGPDNVPPRADDGPLNPRELFLWHALRRLKFAKEN